MLLHWDWLTPALERCEVEGCGLGLGAKRWCMRWWLGALGARSWVEGWGEGEGWGESLDSSELVGGVQ